jgi:hypothetical protein
MSGQRSAGVDHNGNPFVGRSGIERRRAMVLDFHLRGMTNHAIAAILKVHRNTVTNDLKAIKKQQADAVRNLDPDEETGAALDYYLKLRDQAYAQYLEADNANAKLGFLQAAIRAQDMHMRLLMDTGTVERTPTKISSSHGGTIQHKHDFNGKSTSELETRRRELLGDLGFARGGTGRN